LLPGVPRLLRRRHDRAGRQRRHRHRRSDAEGHVHHPDRLGGGHRGLHGRGGAGRHRQARLALRLRHTDARIPALGALVAAVVATAAIVGYPIAMLSATGFDQDRLGDHPGYAVGIGLSYAAIWLSLVAVVACGVALRTSGILRRTGLIVAIIAGLVLVTDVVAGGAWPPAVVGLLVLPYGIGLLRRRVASPA
jgi:hypothetical protein